jgi:hypothetical protein
LEYSTKFKSNFNMGKSSSKEPSEKGHPYVSTVEILQNYTQDPPPDIPNEVLQGCRATQQKHSETVDELRRWFKARESGIFTKILRRVFARDVKIRMPAKDRLYRAINHFFPPRSDIMVTVCDFGPGKAERKEVRLGDIERHLESKPEWSTVRWM